MMIAILPLIVCILGLVIYLIARPDNAKLAEVGRVMFWTGLLVTLMAHASHMVKL